MNLARPRQRPLLSEALAAYWTDTFPYIALAQFLGLAASDDDDDCANIDDDNVATPLIHQRFALFSQQMGAEVAHAHFSTLAEWRAAMCLPVARIEVGAWVDRSADGSGKPLSAALVFDLDADDYGSAMLADCIPGKKVAMNEAAWKQMALSAALLDMWVRYFIIGARDEAMQDVRGLGVFSGRRGIHLWYPEVRRDWSNIADTECIILALGKLTSPQNASSLRQSLENYPPADTLLEALLDFAKEALRGNSLLWERLPSTSPMHAFLWNLRADCTASGVNAPSLRSRLLTAGILIAAPRIDNAVTKTFTHLIKAPFSPHPGTNNISIPFRLGVPIPNLSEVLVRIDDPDCSERVKDAASYLNVPLSYTAPFA